jgi:flagellar protein FlbT
MLMDPSATTAATTLSRRLIESALQAFVSPAIVAGLRTISGQIDRGRNFEALKALRALFAIEEKEMYPNGKPIETSEAA